MRGSWKPFRRTGEEICAFLPVRSPFIDLRINYHSRRRVVAIDQRVGYLGGMNVAQYYARSNELGRWRDTRFRIEDSAVAGSQCVFPVDWAVVVRKHFDLAPYFAEIDRGAAYEHPIAMQLLTDGPQARWLTIEQASVKACSVAHEKVLIQTSYFPPPEELLMNLCNAAVRGVHVCVMIPRRGGSYLTQCVSDSYPTQLIQTGVGIRRYRGGFLHSKLMTVGRRVVGVDSASIGFRGLEINLEVMAFVCDRLIAEELCKAFEVDLQLCHQLTPAEWGKRPLWIRNWEAVARLFSPLL